MAMNFDDDLLLMMNTDEFGVQATYGSIVHGISTINGIFNNGYNNASFGSEIGFATRNPEFYCRSVDVVDVAIDDTIEIASVTYKIKEIMPDGTGLSVFTLELT